MYGFNNEQDARTLLEIARVKRYQGANANLSHWEDIGCVVYFATPKENISAAEFDQSGNLIMGIGTCYLLKEEKNSTSVTGTGKLEYCLLTNGQIAEIEVRNPYLRIIETGSASNPNIIKLIKDRWGAVVIFDQNTDSGGAQVKFAKFNQTIMGSGQTRYMFAPVDQNGSLISADADSYINAKIPPYLTIDQIEVGGIYRIEYIADYNNWFLTDGQCSEYVSPYAPVRMTMIEAYPDDTNSGNIDDTVSATGITGQNVYVNATFNSSLSTGTENQLFTTAPTINVSTFTQNYKTYWRYTFSGLKLKNHVKGIACYDVYATDGNGVAYSAYRLSFKLYAYDYVPELTWNSQTINVYLGDAQQSFTVGTVTDDDGDAVSLTNIRMEGTASEVIDDYDLTIANGTISLSLTPVSEDNTAVNNAVIKIYFQLDDGYLEDANGIDNPYQEYCITVNVSRRQQ